MVLVLVYQPDPTRQQISCRWLVGQPLLVSFDKNPQRYTFAFCCSPLLIHPFWESFNIMFYCLLLVVHALLLLTSLSRAELKSLPKRDLQCPSGYSICAEGTACCEEPETSLPPCPNGAVGVGEHSAPFAVQEATRVEEARGFASPPKPALCRQLRPARSYGLQTVPRPQQHCL